MSFTDGPAPVVAGLPADTFERLLTAAREIQAHAYAPYSNYQVGAAALVEDGRIVTGCNVENASYGVGLCAECGLVSALNASGGGRLVAFVCVGGDGRIVTPCGRCRQLLFEFGGPRLQLWMPGGVMPMSEVLPGAFGPLDLLEADGAAPVPENLDTYKEN